MEQNKDEIIENFNAQLASLNKLHTQSLTALHEAQTALILRDKIIQRNIEQINQILQEKEELVNKLNELQNTINCIRPEIQFIEE